ncbi:MAG TPA: glycoside hydrolase family 3 C-terminal domain-containing protein, partial [Kineosporiaceae bacterium]|nr:glycoside hydrolase family 3 C-terminal domain-containing protein [Kineosporiaceae bacterium]
TELVQAGGTEPQAAADVAADADAAIVVVGYTAQDEGEYVGSFDPALATLYPPEPEPGAFEELARVWDAGPQDVGGDRTSLRLHPEDEAVIRAVAEVNPRVVVVLVAGSAVITEGWGHLVPGVLVGWYAGMEGGHALADVLLGRAQPGGRLPFAVPRDEADLPPFERDATSVVYDRWHGQRRLDRDGVEAAYPLGFGLAYTTFEIGEVEVRPAAGGGLEVHAVVANTGGREGAHVVQVYVTRPALVDRPAERFLAAFARVEVPAGESRAVRVDVPPERLAVRHGPGDWRVPSGRYRVDVGADAADRKGGRIDLDLP